MSRLTDYGIVVMTHMAVHRNSVVTARELSDRSQLPLPTVSKVLKLLSRAQLIESQRGVNGGYQLARLPEEICVTEMIDALEGPIAITNCSISKQTHHSDFCQLDGHCPVKSPWQKINLVVRSALSKVTLRDMSQSISVASQRKDSL